MSRAIGRYELVRPLARGGMAEVFLARRRAAGVEKLLVVKRIRAERADDPRFRALFKREASLSMDLTHQNIVQTFDFGSVGDQFFLAMERVEGKDLGSSLARAKPDHPMSPLVAAFVAAECCQALHYAHGRRKDNTPLGIIHRDVTLRNVLVSWSGEVKLTDFGIAVLAGDDTSKLVGTPAYMAPEQARGEAIDVRTDLYAVGMVLRELLTGERARPGEDRDTLIGAARQGTLAPWPAGADATLVAICDRATSVNPADRYADAHEMHEELDAFIVAQRAERRGDSPGRQLATWLGAVWGDERDEAVTGDGELPSGPAMMSFLDDGAAIGTGTERSLAMTAADEGEPEPKSGVVAAIADAAKSGGVVTTAKSGAVGASVETKSDTDARNAETVQTIDPVAPTVEKPVEAVDKPEPRRGRQLAVFVVLAAIAVVAIVVLRSNKSQDDGRVVIAADAAAQRVDAAAVVEPADAGVVEPVDAAVIADDAETGSARQGSGSQTARQGSGSQTARQGSGSQAARQGSGSQTARQGSGSQGSGSQTARQGSGSQTARQGSGSQGSADPQVVLRKVHINATPWAFFSVDGGPRYQTPKLLDLAPGPHQIHFENNVLKIERTITLVVPADRDISHVEPLR